MEGEASSSRQANLDYPVNVAEAKDGFPVANVDWFQVAGLAAITQGHISEEGFQSVLAALERDAR